MSDEWDDFFAGKYKTNDPVNTLDDLFYGGALNQAVQTFEANPEMQVQSLRPSWLDDPKTWQEPTEQDSEEERIASTRKKLLAQDKSSGITYGDEDLNLVDRVGLGLRQGVAGIGQSVGGILEAIPGARDTGKALSRYSRGYSKSIADISDTEKSDPIGTFTQWITGAATTSLLPQLPAALLGGPTAAAVVAGAQSFGGTYSDAVEAYEKKGFTEDEARSKAYMPAAVSGLITGILTRVIPGGPEFVKGAVLSATIMEAVKQLPKAFVKEFGEEWFDEFGQGIVQKASYNPEKSWSQVVKDASIAGLAGGIISGGVRATQEAIGGIASARAKSQAATPEATPRITDDILQKLQTDGFVEQPDGSILYIRESEIDGSPQIQVYNPKTNKIIPVKEIAPDATNQRLQQEIDQQEYQNTPQGRQTETPVSGDIAIPGTQAAQEAIPPVIQPNNDLQAFIEADFASRNKPTTPQPEGGEQTNGQSNSAQSATIEVGSDAETQVVTPTSQESASQTQAQVAQPVPPVIEPARQGQVQFPIQPSDNRIGNTALAMDSVIELQKPMPYGLTPAKDGTVSTQSFVARLKKTSGGEYAFLNRDGKLDAFLNQNPRASVEQLRQWIQQNSPTLDIVSLSADSTTSEDQQELSRLQHEMESKVVEGDVKRDHNRVGYYVFIGPLDTYRRELIKADVEKFNTLNGKSASIYANDSATARNYFVNPKPLSKMPGAVDLVLRRNGEEVYKEPHFPKSGSNALGHVRAYFEIGQNGEKIFHIFELQSQWAQDIAKRGIRNQSETSKLADNKKRIESIRQQLQALDAEYDAVPTGEGPDPLPDALSAYGKLNKRAENLQEELDDIKFDNSDLVYKFEKGSEFVLDYAENLLLKSAVDHAIKNGATHIALSDGQTAMMTEGHDRSSTVVRFKKGMLQAYDSTLPNALKNITGNKPETISFGSHKNGPSQYFNNKSDITARVYSLDKAKQKIEAQGGLRVFNRQGEISSPIVPQGTVQPVVQGPKAKGVVAIRAMLNDPANKLPRRVVDEVNALLDTPALQDSNLPNLEVEIRSGGDMANLRAAVIGGKIVITPDVQPGDISHEASHILEGLLPESYVSAIEKLRLAELQKRYGSNIPANLASGTMTSDEFIQAVKDGTAKEDDYSLTTPQEFLAKFVGQKFADDTFNSRNAGELKKIWTKVRQWFQGVLDALQRARGKDPSLERVYREMLAGTYRSTPESGKAFEARQGMYVADAAEATRARQSAEARAASVSPQAVDVQTKLVDAQVRPLLQVVQSHISASASPEVHSHLGTDELSSILSAAAVPNVNTTVRYADLRLASLSEPYIRLMGLEASKRVQAMKDKWLGVVKAWKALEEKIAGPGFQTKLTRLPSLQSAAQLTQQTMKDFEARTKDAIRDAITILQKQAGNSGVAAVKIKELEDSLKTKSGIQSALQDMVKLAARDPALAATLWNLTPADVGTFVAQYSSLKQTLFGKGLTFAPASPALIQTAADILAASRSNARGLISLAMINSNTAFANKFRAASKQMAKDLQADPRAFIRQILNQQKRNVRNQITARDAWLALKNDVTDTLREFQDLTLAKDAIEDTLVDPEFIELQNLAASDGKVEIRPNSTVKVDGKDVDISSLDYDRLEGKPIIPAPDGSLVKVDMTADDFGPERLKLEKLYGDWTQWKLTEDAKPPEQRDPNYQFFTNWLHQIDNILLASSVTNPTKMDAVVGGPFDILDFLLADLGTRNSAMAKKSAAVFRKVNQRAEQVRKNFIYRFTVEADAAVKSMGLDVGRTKEEARLFLYDEVIRPMAAIAQHPDADLSAGMIVGEGYKVSKEALEYFRSMAEGGNKGFAVIQDEVPKDLSNIALPPMIKSMTDGIAIRGQALAVNEYTVPSSGYNQQMAAFTQRYLDLKTKSPAEAQALLDNNWKLIFSYLNSRNPINKFGASPFENAYRSVADNVQAATQAGTMTQAQKNLDWVADQISQINGVQVADVKKAVTEEIEGVLGYFNSLIEKDPSITQVGTADIASSTTKRRDDMILPDVFVNYGYRTSADWLNFTHNIHNYSFKILSENLAQMEVELEAQANKLVDETRALSQTAGISEKKARKQILSRNERNLLNGTTTSDLRNLDQKLAKVKRMKEGLTSVYASGRGSLQFSPGLRLIGEAVRGALTSPGTLLTNANQINQISTQMAMITGNAITDSPRVLSNVWLKGMIRGLYDTGGGAVRGLIEGSKEWRGWINGGSLSKGTAAFLESLTEGITTRLYDLQTTGHVLSEDLRNEYLAKISNPVTMGLIRDTQDNSQLGDIARGLLGYFDVMVGTAFIKPLLPAMGDAMANVSADASMGGALRIIQNRLDTVFETLNRRGLLNTRFDFANPKSDKNRIGSKEMYHDHPLIEAERTFLQMKKFVERAGLDFDQIAFEYLKAKNAGTTQPMFNDEQESALRGQFVQDVNVPTATNRPWAAKAGGVNAWIYPLWGWNIKALRTVLDQFSRASASPGDSKLKLIAAVALRVAPILAAYGLAEGLSNIYFKRWLYEWLFGAKRAERLPWENDGTKRQAIGYFLGMISPIPFVNMFANSALNDAPGRRAFDITPLMVNKLKDITRYVGGVIQTGDITHGLPQLAASWLPISQVAINQLDSQEGLVQARNIANLLRRVGPADLLKQSGQYGGVPTQLSPLLEAMENAAYRGDLAEFERLKTKAEEVAVSIGKEPKNIEQAFNAKNPYSKVFKEKLTETQREELLSKLSAKDRALVESLEQKYLDAAALFGGKEKQLTITDEAKEKKDSKKQARIDGISSLSRYRGGSTSSPYSGAGRTSFARPVRGVNLKPSTSITSISSGKRPRLRALSRAKATRARRVSRVSSRSRRTLSRR